MWNALTSSSNFVLESLETFAESTGVAGLIANMGWGSLIMICVAFFLLYLAIKHKFEPLLLLTIAFGMLLTNLPGANLYHTELFAGGHVHWDIFVAQAGLLDYLYLGVKLGIYPCLIFVGVGAMTDFGPLIANPKSFLLGAAAQNKAEWDEKALLRLERILKMDDCRAAAELSACANRAKTRLKKSAALLAMR